jgi:hypothetical protein
MAHLRLNALVPQSACVVCCCGCWLVPLPTHGTRDEWWLAFPAPVLVTVVTTGYNAWLKDALTLFRHQRCGLANHSIGERSLRTYTRIDGRCHVPRGNSLQHRHVPTRRTRFHPAPTDLRSTLLDPLKLCQPYPQAPTE